MRGHGKWEVRSKCRLRLLYVPAVGAPAHYRQAGPIPQDVEKAVQIQEERIKSGIPVEREKINAKAIARVRAQVQEGTTVEGTPAKPGSDGRGQPKAKAPTQVVESGSESSTPGTPLRIPKKTPKRVHDLPAEIHEHRAMSKESPEKDSADGSWAQVTP